MATLSNAVLDAALNYIKNNTNKVQVVNASSTALVSKASSVSSADFGSSPGDNSGSGGGRKIECLTGSDFQSLAVSTGGSATSVRLLATSTVVATASIASSPVSLGSSDTVNISSFSVIIKDPT